MQPKSTSKRPFSHEFVCQAIGVSPSAGAVSYVRVETDSRQVQAGDLFVALKGDQFDGHQFLEQAIKAGATGVISKKPVASEVTCYQVPDTLKAFRDLAGAWRRQFQIPVFGVGGSVGKTSTKEMLAILCGPHTLKTDRSENGFIGIPKTLLRLREEHRAAVIEIGIDDVGAMKQHVDLVRPGFSVLTALGPEHLHQLRDEETAAREEWVLLQETATQGGKVALNLDEAYIRKNKSAIEKSKCLGFTLDQENFDGEILRAQFTSPKDLEIENHGKLECPLLGKVQARNFLSACALAKLAGIPLKSIPHLENHWGRSQVEKWGESTVLCDFYNANPTSTRAALKLLKEICNGPLIACLGDMLELGEKEEDYHRELAPLLETLDYQAVFLYGPKTRWIEQELKEIEFPGVYQHFEDHAALAKELRAQISGPSGVLIKGSRGMRMEEVWKDLQKYGKTAPA